MKNQAAWYAILSRVERSELNASEALPLLKPLQSYPTEAREAVFISLGGSSIVDEDANGRACYRVGDRLTPVEEVRSRMEEIRR